MIRFILLQNRAGKTRLAKYYVPVSDAEKRKQEYDVHRLIVGRDPKQTNFVEVGGLGGWAAPRGGRRPRGSASPCARCTRIAGPPRPGPLTLP